MRVLLFDIDGTLLLTNGGGSGALKHALEREFGVSEACTNVDFAGRTDRSLLEEILCRNRMPNTREHFERLRDCYTTLLPRVLQEHGGKVLPGAVSLLEQLRDRNDLICHVMTGNLTATATVKLEHFGLRHYFDDIFGGEHDAHRNDLARRTAETIRARHGEAATREIIVIGDTPADVQCGHAIGASVLAVCSGRHGRHELEAERPMSVHDDLSDLAAILQLLTGPLVR